MLGKVAGVVLFGWEKCALAPLARHFKSTLSLGIVSFEIPRAFFDVENDTDEVGGGGTS